MKKNTLPWKQLILTTVFSLVLIFVSLHGVHAQTSASLGGDDVCGSSATTECSAKDFKKIAVSAVYQFIIPIGSALMVALIMYRLILAYKALVQGNSNAYKEALKDAFNSLVGMTVVVLVISGVYVGLLNYLGTQGWATTIFNFFSANFVSHAYAATNGTILPNPLGVTSLYDLLLQLVRLVVRWFIFPAVIAMWVWTGFAYVAAQGAPEKIALAHKWLLYAVITTVLIMTTEGFLFALRGTIQQVVPQQQTTTSTTPTPPAPAPVPAPACTIAGTQTTGQTGVDGVCYPTNRGGGSGPVTSCSGQPVDTTCSISGSIIVGKCGYSDEDHTYGCYVK